VNGRIELLVQVGQLIRGQLFGKIKGQNDLIIVLTPLIAQTALMASILLLLVLLEVSPITQIDNTSDEK
jgi:hypothetical protein